MAWFTPDWFSSHHTVRCAHKSGYVINFSTVACRISLWLKWYKNYKNRLRLAKVIVKNKCHVFYGSVCSNWHPIWYRFGVIAAYCSNFAPTRPLWLQISGRRGHPPNHFAPIVRPMNALQLCPWQFSHSCYGSGATSENRSKIGDFAPTRSLWSKISGTRCCPHQ